MKTIIPSNTPMQANNYFGNRLKGISTLFTKNCFKAILFLSFISLAQRSYADYTITAGSTVNASTLTGQSGTLHIYGTLNINADVTLSNITSIIVYASNGEIYWAGNYSLRLSSSTTIDIQTGADGLQPQGGSASKRLYIGTVVVAVSNENSNNASFSFEEFNNLGGMPQFTLTTNSPLCIGNAINVTATPSKTSNFTFHYTWSSSPATLTFSPATANSTGGTSTTTTPSSSGVYNIILTVKDGNGDLITTKSSSVSVFSKATISRTSATGTDAQTVCTNSAITNITYSIGGTGTGASATGLPSGVNGVYNAGTFTLSGAPTVAGTYNYTVTTTGGNCPVSATGTITVSQGQTLTGVTTSPVCESFATTVQLTGVMANAVNNTVNYSINGVAQTPITGVNSNASGVASFATGSLALAQNNQTLQITSITNNGCQVNFTNSTVLTVRQNGTWLGNSTVWTDAANWCNGVPTTSTDAILPNGVTFYPAINAGTVSVNDITLASAASVTVSNATMRISGIITNSGVMNFVNGNLELNGASLQTIAGSSFYQRTLNGLVVSNPAGVNIASTANDTLNVTGFIRFGNINNVTLNTGDNLALKSSATATARVEDLTNNGVNTGNKITGKTFVERFLPMLNSSTSRRWRLLTTPIKAAGAPTINQSWQEGASNSTVSGPINPRQGYGTQITNGNTSAAVAKGFDLGTTASPSIYYMNPGNAPTWVVPDNTNATSIASQEGFMIFVRGDRSIVINNQYVSAKPTTLAVKGELNTGTVTKSLVQGKQVIGNPYASAIRFDNVLINGTTPNNEGHYYYYWDPKTSGSYNVGRFVTVGNDGVGSPSSYTVTPQNNTSGIADGVIESGAAIVVVSNQAAPGTIVFNETDKVNASSTVGIASRPGNNNTSARPTGIESLSKLYTNMYAVATDGSLLVADGVANTYYPAYNNAVDEFDAPDLASFNSKENLSIARGGVALSIEKRKTIVNTDTVYLEMRNMDNRKYKFEFVAQNFGIYTDAFLQDNYTGTLSQIKLNGVDTTTYDFTVNSAVPASAAIARFKILFRPSVAASPLPVLYNTVKAYQQNKNVAVDWTVENETNIKQYVVEKSKDGASFTAIATQTAGANGMAYTQNDIAPYDGVNYYRIKAVNVNGEITYSKIVKVTIGKGASAIAVYPTVLQGGVANVQLQNMAPGKYPVRVMNAAGQVIYKKALSHNGGSATESLQLGTMPSGMYTIEIVQPDHEVSSIKVVNP